MCLVWFPEDCQRCERRFQTHNSKISSLGAKRGFNERRGEPANCWHTYSSCLTTRHLTNQTFLIHTSIHTQKGPWKFTKTTLKTGLCCADMRDDWFVICFLSKQITPCHSCCWLLWSSSHWYLLHEWLSIYRGKQMMRKKFSEINLS